MKKQEPWQGFSLEKSLLFLYNKREPEAGRKMAGTERMRNMYQDKVTLCGSSAYEKKFYLNEDFGALPQTIKDELKILCVMYTEEVGGILTLSFEEDGTLVFEVESDEGDLLFDEIGSVLKIKQLQEDKRELLESLELYYKVFFLNEDPAALLTGEEES